MALSENNAYILGTERAELHRLGLQHQVWSSEARRGWKIAEFSYGQTLLDLGCGPGFCTLELGYIVGPEGKVIAVDKSAAFIDFLSQCNQLHQVNIETQQCTFDDMQLIPNSLDGVYSRWALAWIPNPDAIVEKISQALRPGGVFVAQEYYDWSTLQTSPPLPALQTCIAGALKSFKSMEGEIDIGRELPDLFYQHGLEVISTRPLSKLATPDDLTWHWPKTFFNIYFPKVAEMGFLSMQEVEKALAELEELAYIPGATILCPQMVEVVAVAG